MSIIILVARPTRWIAPAYTPTSDAPRNQAELARLPFGAAWSFAPPANWMFYTSNPPEVRALWQTLTSSNRQVVGWGVADLDVPIVRTAAGGEGMPEIVDLARLVFAASARRYDLHEMVAANLSQRLTASNAELALMLAEGRTPEVRLHLRRYAEAVAELYLQLRENKPLLLPAQPRPTSAEPTAAAPTTDTPTETPAAAPDAAPDATPPDAAAPSGGSGTGALHFFMAAPTSYRVEAVEE